LQTRGAWGSTANLCPAQVPLAVILFISDFNKIQRCLPQAKWATTPSLISTLGLFSGLLLRLFRSRRDILLENLALRQQLVVLKRGRRRPRLGAFDKLFWVIARKLWSRWQQVLIVVMPDTVVRWHRAGFQFYGKLISIARKAMGRKPTPRQVRELFFRMGRDNPKWGAPRIHGELLMFGFNISERTISRSMKRAPRDPELRKRWLAFLRDHREAIAAMDFFTVPTVNFTLLYCFLIMAQDCRRILHGNVTTHPRSSWGMQQLQEAFPFASAPRFPIFDRDGKFGTEVPMAIRSMKIKPVRASLENPWQNGVAERWVESSRRDLLDHVIPIHERHLKRLLADYVPYYHEDRTDLGLEKDTPSRRIRAENAACITSQDRLGGFHHRYDRAP
jgi:putative transposase